MIYIKNILFIEFNEIVACGISIRTANRICTIKNPSDKRKVLVEYESLKPRYKQFIFDTYSNPYEYCGLQLFKQYLNSDLNTLKLVDTWKEQLKKHKLPNGTGIPSKYYISNGHRGIYIHACMLLHWLSELNVHKARRYGFNTVETVYKSACKYIETEKLQLPKSVNNLRIKVREFKAIGYEASISGKLGNDNSKKIGKGDTADFQEAFLQELLRQHNNFDYQQVARLYNQEAKLKGFKNITGRTVENFYKKNKLYIDSSRKGTDIGKMQHRRSKPTGAFFYVTADAWDVELPYQERILIKSGKDKGKIKTTYHKRLMLYVVLDTFNNYPIGYSIGKHENASMTIAAYENAINHVKQLTGTYFRPWQIQTDNFLSKPLGGFFESVCKYYTPAATGNAKSKVVERYFHYINKNYCQQHFNWSGFNLSSTNKNQPNTSAQNKLKKHYPTEQEVREIIINFIHEERSKKQDEWLQNFRSLESSKRLELSRQDYLLLFGTQKPETNKIHGSILSPTINGKTMMYDSFDLDFRKLISEDWITYYDDKDYATILAVSSDGKHQFLLDQKYIQPMAIMDRQEGDFEQLRAVEDFNEKLESVFETKNEDRFVTISEEIDNDNDVTAASTLVKQGFSINGQQKRVLDSKNSLAKSQQKILETEQKELKESENEALLSRLEYLNSKNLPNILDNE